ncbi:MAG: hypothetical protein IOC82_12935 [Aestuariivirga sp.]|uniref:hypothetical protein n=1 Tax=Aestuariivirga sp. TaxID=2650926 RepID=UPI0025BB3212|nr:hypothetical protein [Aestuariivirga sp.]MCA3561922.1 hypothetical protein [Aestuariivirga sp.]
MLSTPENLVLESFGLCVLAFVVIVALHLMGLHASIRLFRVKFKVGETHSPVYHKAVIVILSAMMLLFCLYMMTDFACGLFMYLAGALLAYREGVYYSLENYTSLGLTRVNVDDRWRMLAPMISMSGVFCLSWSTAVLVSFFGQLYHIKLDD